MTDSLRTRLSSFTPLLLLATTFAVFGPSLFHEFLSNWDDPAYVTANEAVRGITLAHLREAFTSIYVGNYAPVQIVSYMLDHAVWGMRPAGFIFTNILLHGMNGILLYILIVRLHQERLWALLSALLFLIHPIQVESVVWISQRKNLLALFFSLAVFHLYLNYRNCEARKGWWYAAALAAFMLALLAKSVAIVVPVILLCYDLCYHDVRPSLTHLLDKIPFVVAAVAVAAVTIMTQGEGQGGGRHAYPGGPLTALFSMLPVYVRYLTLLFWPTGLSAIYPYTVREEADATVLLSAALLCALLAALVWLYRRNRPLAFWAIVFLVGFLPVSQVVPMLTQMNDRYCYFPLVGGAPFLARGPALLLRRWLSWQGGCGTFLVLLLFPLSWLSIEREKAWQNAVTLWEYTAQKTPSKWAQYNLIDSLLKRADKRWDDGDQKGALSDYQRILAIDPRNQTALYGIGLLNVKRWNLAEAHDSLLRLTTYYPDDESGFLLLGFVLKGRGDLPEALAAYERALEINPGSAEAVKALSDIRIHLNRSN